ncbi:hypothetical protein EVAR_100512_1 [Eumeta japonica]|uniref:Uncharacterized protein n=1 Tax=Eumeta variegata TaxID=151549 RepID=A0A4C2AAM8_EUMVA|nr:hypothetical protein EVAR_100512_1 [Eumeta japonica]
MCSSSRHERRPGEWHVSTARADRPIGTREIDPILPEEWKIIECCVELLKPLKKPRELSSSHTLISSVIPIIRMLTQKLAETRRHLGFSNNISKYRKSEENENDRLDTDTERPGTSEIRIRIRGCEPLKIRIRMPHPRMCEKVDPQHP